MSLNVKKFGNNEHPFTMNSFLCIILLVTSGISTEDLEILLISTDTHSILV